MGKSFNLGLYETEEEAKVVFIEASKKYFPNIRYPLNQEEWNKYKINV
jgi:hypothetical protein